MLLHMDNFAVYGGDLSKMLDGVYASITSGGGNGPCALQNDPDGISTGKVLYVPGGVDPAAGARFVLPGTTDTVGMGFRVWMSSLPLSLTTGTPAVWIRDANNAVIAVLYVLTTGALRMDLANVGGTMLAQTSGPVVTANGWWHIELKYVRSATASGSLEVRVEGVPVMTVSNVITGPLTIAQVSWGCYSVASGGSGAFPRYKDLFVWNGAGAQNNNFLGSCVVYSLLPDSDVALNWGLTGAANGYSILATAPPADTTKYLSAAYPPPAASTFGLSDLPANVTSVKALMSQVRAKKIDGGDGNLQSSIVSGASTGDGANRPITAAFTYWRDFFEVDPATAAPWTVNAANAARLKINRTV